MNILKNFSIKMMLVLLLFPAVIPAVSAVTAWERVPPPPAFDLVTVTAPASAPGKIFAASRRQVFEKFPGRNWNTLWHLHGSVEIRKILTFPQLPDNLFLLTTDGLYRGNSTESKRLTRIFRGTRTKDKLILSFSVLPADPDHWFLGTENGLWESDDAGATWYSFSQFYGESIGLVYFTDDHLFAAARNRLYLSRDLEHFEPVFSLVSGDHREFLELEESENLLTKDEPAAFLQSDLIELLPSESSRTHLWLATRKGVFFSMDGGNRWTRLPTTGLTSLDIQHIIFAPVSGKLIAAARRGVFYFDPQANHWQELFRGMDSTEVRGLAVITTPEEKIIAVTDAGLRDIILNPVLNPGESGASEVMIPSRENWKLFESLIRLEPSAREIHRAVIRFSNLSPGKIKRWHAESRAASLLPNFSFGRDTGRSNNVDIDRGSTNEPDSFILGPEDIDRGWDLDVSWDLGDLIWSSNQTSIDSRDKLTTELRHDFLSEATRLYFERRRTQIETVFTPPTDETDHYNRMIRLEELTALLDAMTGGYFIKKLEAVYREHPEFDRLWNSFNTNRHENGTKEHENPA